MSSNQPPGGTAAADSPGRAGSAEPGPAEQQPAGESASSRTRIVIDALTTANSVTVTALAIVLALIVGGLIIALSDQNVLDATKYFFARPADTFSAMWQAASTAYVALFEGSIVDPGTVNEAWWGMASWGSVFDPIAGTLSYAAPLIGTGLAVALAFRAGMFNIGAQGQAIMGAIGAGLVGFALPWPPVIGVLATVLGGLVGGGLWGLVAGWLKARFGAHEVITTIMLNYIAAPSFITWLVVQHGIQQPGRNDPISKPVVDHAQLPHLFGSNPGANLSIVLVLLAAAGVGWLLNRSTIGFELRAVGSNPDAARTAGISLTRAYLLGMLFAGALAGLGGASIVLGTTPNALTPAVVGNIGFDGITVALLGRGRPLGTVLAGLLVGALQAGASQMQVTAQIPIEVATIIQSLIVVFVAAPALVKAIFRLRAVRGGSLGQNLAKGWNG
jgi:general nucleoside transport system permease protein